jgi:hypothetical protein
MNDRPSTMLIAGATGSIGRWAAVGYTLPHSFQSYILSPPPHIHSWQRP